MAQLQSPSKRLPSRNGTAYVFALSFTLLAILGIYAVRIAALQSGVAGKLEHINTIDRFTEHPMALRTTFTGFAPVDTGVKFLVVAFMHAVSGWDEGFFVFLIYFLVSFFSILSVWAVESCRERNNRALTRFTYVFALLYQTVGGAIIIPIYYLVYLYETSNNSYWTESRHVPLSYAKAILPAVVIGYLLPTALMFLPYSAPNMWTTQAMVALWQPCPWFVDSLIYIMSKLYSDNTSNSPQNGQQHAKPAPLRKDDVPYLQRIYALSFVVTTLAHLSIVYLMLFSANPAYSFSHVFLHPKLYSGAEMTLLQGLLAIFQADFWIIFVSSVLWAYLAILDAKRVGLTDANVWTAGVLVVVQTVLVGPGAVVSGVWYWREGRMVDAEERKEKAG